MTITITVGAPSITGAPVLTALNTAFGGASFPLRLKVTKHVEIALVFNEIDGLYLTAGIGSEATVIFETLDSLLHLASSIEQISEVNQAEILLTFSDDVVAIIGAVTDKSIGNFTIKKYSTLLDVDINSESFSQVGSMLFGKFSSIDNPFSFSGMGTTSVPGASDFIYATPVNSYGFTVTANAGVTDLSVAIQGATNQELSDWVTLGVVSLSAPGSGSLNSQLFYHGYRVLVISVVGGSCGVSMGEVRNAANSVTNPIYTGIPVSGSQIISQSAVPIILPSTFTMGDNGALSGMVASNFTTYSDGAWIVLGANALFSGSLAGTYWSIWSTANACTVYQETLPVGVAPYIVVSPTYWLGRTGLGVITPAVNQFYPIVSIPVAAGIMGINGALKVNSINSMTNGTLGINGFFGVAGGGGTQFSGGSNAALPFAGTEHNIRNRGLMNRNLSVSTNSNLVDEGAFTGGLPTYMQIDTSQTQYVNLGFYITNATHSAVLEAFSVEVKPA